DDWAHWQGLSLHGGKVVLHYTVGDMSVLELPGLERRGETTAFSRTFNLGPSTTDQVVQIVFEEGRQAVEWMENEHAPSLILLPPPKVADVPPADAAEGLVHGYRFEDPARFLRDEIAGGIEPEPNGARWTEGGREGGGLGFRDESWLELPDAPVIDFQQQDLTVSAWIKTGEDGVIFSQTMPEGRWVPNGKAFFVRGGKLGFDVGWVGAVGGRKPVADDQWHHVAFTHAHQDGSLRLYLDGALDGEGKLQPKAAVTNHVVRLGFAAANFPARPWFHGAMDEVRIYTRRLGDGEIAGLAGREAVGGMTLAAALVDAPAGARWVTDPAGHVRLFLPASKEARRFKVLVWRGAEESMGGFAALAKAAPPAGDLHALTQGGPPRWPEKLVTHGTLGSANGAYAVDTITPPDDNPWKSWLRFGGVDFFSDNRRAAICTWNGDVWVLSGIDDTLADLRWKRFATGLFDPLGLKIVNDVVHTLGRDQITKLHDLNGDGEADFYECFNNDVLITKNFHEFAFDLQTDPQGNFYFSKAGPVRPGGRGFDKIVPHHGCVLKVDKDGRKLEVYATGLRAPNGIGVGPQGQVTSGDNEGTWTPVCRLNWMKQGTFNGCVDTAHRDPKPTAY
ncbi:MAG: hypothetical protein KDM81_13880, partial [Verrucomicrobiae bacterium]|nr:hypothetical protein [Verrucomicrobiae bacterium]